MDYLIAIYTGRKIYTITLKAGITATVGDTQADTVLIERFGLGASYLVLTCEAGGVRIFSREPMTMGEDKTCNRVFSAGDIVTITEKITLAVFESRNRVNASLELQDFNEIRLGRSYNKNDISLKSSEVSSVHALIERDGGRWVISDLGSRNGTFVNGELIATDARVPAENVNIFISGFMFYIQNDSLRFTNTPAEVEFSLEVLPMLVQAPARPKRYPFFQRSPRLRARAEKTEFEILPPPNVGTKPAVSWLTILMPPCMMVLVMSSVAFFTKNFNMLMYSVPMSLMTVVVTIMNNKANIRKWNKTNGLALEKYSEHLDERERDIINSESAYISAMSVANPGVQECIAIAENVSRRLWERTPKDSDFLNVRLGTGKTDSNVKVKLPMNTQLQIEENIGIKKAQELQKRHTTLTGVPVCHSFLSSPITGIVGKPDAVKKMAWRIILDIATHHSYEDVKIVCVYPESEQQEWEWLKWLPHVWNPARTKRYIACTYDSARSMLREAAETLKIRRRDVTPGIREATPEVPFYVLVLADRELTEASGEQFLPEKASLGFAAVYAYADLSALPGECQSVIMCDPPACIQNTQPEAKTRNIYFTPDSVNHGQLDEFARSLAPVRLLQTGKGDQWPKSISFLQGFHVRTVEELRIFDKWGSSFSPKSLAAQIGVRSNGDTFSFDIYEKAMGPHGITAGTSGSGKSEMLTTWLLSMAMNFSPDDVNFALIEFKGNDLSNILKPLPHIAGVVSNMNDPSTITRSIKSLEGEKARRMKIFEDAVWLSTKSISAYQTYQKSHRDVKPLPYLIIVVDEFAEFATQYPEYAGDFINSIVRVGRSIGMYAVLTMQSPQGVIKGQVSANTKFRICLKTANASESKEILGTNDAFGISAPGRAIVKVGNNEVYEQVQTFYAKAPYTPDSGKKGPVTEINIVALDGKRSRPEIYDKTVKAARDALSEGNAIVNNIIDTAKEHHIDWARHVWLDPLPEMLSLDELISENLAYKNGVWEQRNDGLAVRVGKIDAPENQDQYPFILDFMRDGHQILYGAPSSGKTTFLQTLLLSAAQTYTPEQTHFLILDYGNWGLKIFETLPHTLVVVDPGDKEKIDKAKNFLYNELSSRKALFASQDVGNLEAYREVSGKTIPTIILAIDNMASLYNNNPELMDVLVQTSREGGSLGIFMVMTAGSTGSFMFRIAQYVKSNHTLQMTEKGDYRSIVGGNGHVEPGHYAGRGLTKGLVGPLEFQTALCVSGATEGERVKRLREVCKAMSESWTGKRATMEEPELEPIEIGEMSFSDKSVQIGVNKQTRQPVDFVFKDMNGCVISGTDGGGKTNVLASIARALGKDDKTKLYIYEEKSFLENLCPNATVAHDAKKADEIVGELAAEFDNRDDDSEGRVVFCIDDFAKFYNGISQESADILDNIASGGTDRGVYLYIVCDTSGLAKMSLFKVKLFETLLANGNVVVVGGNMASYKAFESLHRNKDLHFAEHEGCVIHNNKVTSLVFAKVERA